MAGFFSLSSGRGKEEAREQEENNNTGNTNNQFLFRNEEIYNNKGFEIWPQPQPQPSSFHHQQNLNNFYSFGVGGGGGGSSSRRNENNLNDDVSVSFSDESTRFGLTVMRSSGGGLSGGGMNCQDCGNQAKKDCPHLRCRTCCKSRGFQCQTHVKSTWVPAAKRRERQHQLSSLQQQNQQHQQQQFHSSRRQRENPNDTSAAGASGSLACTPIPITTTGLELGNFPPELNSPAVFRCVKVSAMDAQDERYAYQTAVNIGGRIFKGILYDQGLEGNYTTANAGGGGGEGSSGAGVGGGGEGNQQNLITTTTTNVNNPFEYSSLYPAPLNAFMAGTQFFPPPRS